MKKITILTTLSAVLILAVTGSVSGKEYNKRPHLDPGSQSKVNAVIASGRKDRTSKFGDNGRITNKGCGNLNIGQNNLSKRPAREIIIVARDIINVGGKC
jgi:hypothetical protein